MANTTSSRNGLREPIDPAPARGARRPRRRSLLLVASVALGLLAPLVANASAAQAAAVPNRTALERHIGWVVEDVINAERHAHHLKPIHMSPKLLVSARRHNLAMSRSNTMSHRLRGEASFGRRIDVTGYRWVWAGENIAWNSRMSVAGVVQLEKLMYAEKAPNNGHRKNILNRHFKDVGIDIYMDKKHHKVWLTTDFGHR